MALLYSSVPVSHGSVTVSQREQKQDPETVISTEPDTTSLQC